MPENPHCIRDDAGFPLVERKMGLVLWLDEPPSPRLARSVYDIYMHRCGERVRGFCSTAPGSLVLPWTTATRQTFEDKKLPALRPHRDWGYGFADDQEVDSWLFMFHGARPQSEPDRAEDPRDLRLDLFERAFVEFAFATPERLKLKGRTDKYLHRLAMRGVLPEVVRSRPTKASFMVTFLWHLPELFAELERDGARAFGKWVAGERVAEACSELSGSDASDRSQWQIWTLFGCGAVDSQGRPAQ